MLVSLSLVYCFFIIFVPTLSKQQTKHVMTLSVYKDVRILTFGVTGSEAKRFEGSRLYNKIILGLQGTKRWASAEKKLGLPGSGYPLFGTLLFVGPLPLDFEFLRRGMPQDTPEGSGIWCSLLSPLLPPTTPIPVGSFWHKCQLGKNWSHCTWPKCIKKQHHMYLLTDSGRAERDGKICGSRSGRTDQAQRGTCVLTESQILSGPALPGSVVLFFFFFWWSENLSMAAFVSFRARLSQQPYAFFRPYHLARTALIRNFFHMAFQRNCARERTGYMLIHFINLACVAGLNYVCVAELVWYLPKIPRYSRYISAITAKSKSCLESVCQQAFIFSFSVLPWYIITVLVILETTSAVVIQNRNWYCRRVRMIWSGHR